MKEKQKKKKKRRRRILVECERTGRVGINRMAEEEGEQLTWGKGHIKGQLSICSVKGCNGSRR